MLVMGMSSKKQKTPAIRLKGFTDAWEQCKLEDLAESFNYGLNASAMEFDGENKYIRITDIDEQSHKFIQSGLTSPNTDLLNADDYLLKEGDILFARTGASVGKSYQYEPLDGKVYYAGFLIRARIKPEFDPRFIFQNTLTEKYNNFIKVTSQRSGQPGVNAQEYANFSILIPSRGEQVKLGNFFKQLDDTIALHQRQLDNYKQLKKSMLQKIFNQEFRFKDEHENDFPEWENHKLGEVITEFNGKTEVNNQYPPLTSSRRGLFLQEDYFNRQVASKDTTGYNIVPYGYFTYRHMSDDLEFYFNINYLVPNGIVSTLYPVFTTKEIMNSNFLQIILNNGKEFKQFAILQKQGGSRTYMYLSKLKELILNIPCYLEQQEIVNFTLALDKKIELEEQKLKLLRKQKNWVMQQMFV